MDKSRIIERFDISASMAHRLKLNQFNNSNELLIIYGLYKQATIGDCNTEEPNDLVDNKKWHSWKSYKGLNKYDAMDKYSDYVLKYAELYGLSKLSK